MGFDCGGELNPTVAGILCGPEFDSVYGTLCAALQNPGNQYLFEALNDTQATSTVWAPNNEAFENLNTVFANVQGVNMGVDDGNTMHDFLFSPKGEPILTNVLLYHVANGFIHSDQLSCDGEVTTVLGTSTTICDAAATGPIFQVGPGNTDTEFRPKYENIYGTEACNGVIYSLDNVILPVQSQLEAVAPKKEEDESSTSIINTTATVTAPLPSGSLMMNNNNAIVIDNENAIATLTSPFTSATALMNNNNNAYNNADISNLVVPRTVGRDCSSRTLCSEDEFCNYDNGLTGFCESCSEFISTDLCFLDGLPNDGANACAESCGLSCGAPGAQPTIYESICKNPLLTTLCQELSDTGTLDTLLNEDGTFTTWAPTNQGFKNLDDLQGLGGLYMPNILEYHISDELFYPDQRGTCGKVFVTRYLDFTHYFDCSERDNPAFNYTEIGALNVAPNPIPTFVVLDDGFGFM